MTARHPITPSPCSPCTHHHAIEGLDSCYCPDCKRSFAQGTAGYKEIIERDSEKDRWNEEHFGEVPFKQEESGQVTLFWDTNEPPDPDDFPTLQEFESAWEDWEKSNTSTSNELLSVNPGAVDEFSERKNSGITGETLVFEQDLQPHTQREVGVDNNHLSIVPVRHKPPSKASTSNDLSEEAIPPSKTRRQKGLGTGYLESKPIIRNNQEYPQYWYHYEEWSKGDRLIKSSKYIPKRLVAKIQELDSKKVPVREILDLLGV